MTDTVTVTFDADGLVPVVAQDAETDAVLMVAYANREAVERTVDTGRAHYYSRSREELWEKGATSGNTQRVETVRVDCDADTLLYRVHQDGGACHTGHESCFHRRVAADDTVSTDEELELAVETDGQRVFDPDEVY
ncbi:MAG: phosphoribosyl-AMP cyclohydrolase [halophilic archaeon J07HB67]|nr:MAG: phosphoribosyl-AMP cyclohydrolase [halophilic archaeon J07HB67]